MTKFDDSWQEIAKVNMLGYHSNLIRQVVEEDLPFVRSLMDSNYLEECSEGISLIDASAYLCIYRKMVEAEAVAKMYEALFKERLPRTSRFQALGSHTSILAQMMSTSIEGDDDPALDELENKILEEFGEEE